MGKLQKLQKLKTKKLTKPVFIIRFLKEFLGLAKKLKTGAGWISCRDSVISFSSAYCCW